MTKMTNGRVPRGLVSVHADGGSQPDVKVLVESLNKAFADFKAEHTKQLEEIKKGNADALQALKVDNINADITRLQAAVDQANTQMAAFQMGGGAGGERLADAEYSTAFSAHFRKGDVQAALNKGVAEEGGYLAPVEWDRTITDRLVILSDMRQLANVVPCSGAGLTKLYNMGGTASGWVGEEDARPQTAGPQFKSLGFGWGEIYANPAATQQLLDDSEIDLEAWLAGEVDTEFARQEGAGFFAGDGVNKPFGILTYVEGGANAAKHPFGAIKVVNSGAAAAITADGIIDLVYDLPSAFTANARFAMNRKTQGAVRKLKDAQDNYLWQPSLIAGQPATLAGFPVQDVAATPDVAANAVAALFGDFKQTYTVYDRKGVRVLRDPFTNKPYVQFYTTKRVGGGVHNPEPMRALKIAE
ncbi:phage major capsid protein [Stenotrophomonas maltophilia]|uniref:phage major capsid protein n=1 Tax=Stenotrophomonas maltophilia TaxID=40324 RepID=UPI001861F5FA|nr:phage major capsid protein [Stenotrophomonas maltophilia]MCU1133241.1 phage major capsid protein [Stenotrophomonas maltophilia]QNA95448.1 phage major capsid protein [Stenotrophomonas maltophilia]